MIPARAWLDDHVFRRARRDDDLEACITHQRLPVTHRRSTRTTESDRAFFGEERRRLKIVPNAFGESRS